MATCPIPILGMCKAVPWKRMSNWPTCNPRTLVRHGGHGDWAHADYEGVVPDLEVKETIFPFDANTIVRRSLEPLEKRPYEYIFDRPAGEYEIQAQVQYRTLPPYVLRSLQLNDLVERLLIFDLDEKTLSSRICSHGTVWVLLAFGCGPTLVDTGEPPPTYEELPELITCDTPMEGSGEVAGSMSCSGGICSVPAGLAWLGDDMGEPDECPPRNVEISAFSIDQTEVTRGAYASCEAAGACEAIAEHCDFGWKPSPKRGIWTSCRWCAPIGTKPPRIASGQGARCPLRRNGKRRLGGRMARFGPGGEDAPLCNTANFNGQLVLL